MTTATLTLSDFLLARIAEDYAAADLVLRPYGDHAAANDAIWWTSERAWFDMGLSSDETPLVMSFTPQRVLAECEAKRRIVELHAATAGDDDEYSGWRDGARSTLTALAQPYASHPDFRDEWRA